jgi:hypothetical protein
MHACAYGLERTASLACLLHARAQAMHAMFSRVAPYREMIVGSIKSILEGRREPWHLRMTKIDKYRSWAGTDTSFAHAEVTNPDMRCCTHLESLHHDVRPADQPRAQRLGGWILLLVSEARCTFAPHWLCPRLGLRRLREVNGDLLLVSAASLRAGHYLSSQ